MKIDTLNLTDGEQTIEIIEDTELRATFIGKNSDSIISKFIFLHKKPGLKSRITIKAVLFDNSRFDVEGLLKIEKGAKSTDTYLKINCLVISDNAYARAVPSLEIQESEVKGGHGATIGYINETQKHYLLSKGLDIKTAEELIIDSFLNS